ncbi:TRAP transporter small permease [Virgibacillus salexigens]|uniref:C4-dicarboxylate ABC transporter permease n=1 Tax=Virgibacillus kapii TaxID=1638645 RepID=A0ABQ2DZ09_9BACI|nr:MULTISPECIES: TRAP transporter small permease [Virgibacillus]GGJ73525.1 C4-dicarboxylate ABC transporter permease [Virgibacillus kapii]
MKQLHHIFEKIERIFVILSQTALVIMMILIAADAASRYVFGQSIIGIYEFTERYLMIAVIFLSMSYVAKLDGHIKLDVLIDRLPASVTEIFNTLFQLLGAAFIFAIGYQGMVMTYEAWSNQVVSTGLIAWPVWLSYIWVPVGAYLFTCRLMLQFSQSLLLLLGKKKRQFIVKKEDVI